MKKAVSKDIREFILSQENETTEPLSENYETEHVIPTDLYEDNDKDAEDLISDLSNLDFKESSIDRIRGLNILKCLSESTEEIANEFINKLSDKYTELAQDLGVY